MSTPMNIQHRRTPSMTCYAPQPTHARSLSGQLATSWSDGFEFTSCSPLTSALHLGTSPLMGNVYLPSTAAQLSMSCSPRGDYSSFERDYCSNFACCGITLPDMHALVAHFEETHLGASEGAPFVAPQCGLGVPVPQPKPLPQVITNNTNGTDIGAKGIAASSDASSPNSSVGPETPPPSHVSAYGFPMNGQPHLQLQVQTQLFNNGSRANSASPYPHSPFSTRSPYSASPLSAGSPASLGSIEQQQSEHSSGSGEELEMDMDMDVLMSFDPLDNVNGVHTPLDSTPPSPLAAPIRPSSVLRGHALKISGGQPDALPVCLPPSLFSAPIPSPTLLSPNVEKDSSAKKEKKDRKERERQRKSRAESPASATDDVSATSSGGGAVRREKTRKVASSTMSLLGLGSSSRSSISSSDEGSSASGESVASVVEEKSKGAVVEKPRAERTGRPERPDKSGKRTREKAYKCPKPGCTKSYLNPNGLKYHCAKGTCTFADGTSAPPTPVTPTTPAIPSIASVSLSSTPAVPSASNASANASMQPAAAANTCAVSQPLTPTSLPSSPRMHNQFPATQGQGMYEYHHLQQQQQQQQYQEQYIVANSVINMNMNVSGVAVGNANLNDVPIIAAPVRTMRWR
ncbi:hypothetical protein ACEPAH_8440 [Sanghuangporus vaninii]